MSPGRVVGALVVMLAVIAMQARAQQVISEPGYCTFFCPHAHCQNKGLGDPDTDPNCRRSSARYGRTWSSGQTVGMAPRRARTTHHGSATTRLE